MALSFKQQIICRWICMALSGLGFVCYCVAFIIPYWVYIRTDGHVLRYGVFSVCIVTARSMACGTVAPETVNGVFVAAQAFATLALLTYFVAAVSCALTLCWPYPWSRYFLFVCGGSALITTLFGGTMTVLYIMYHVEMLSSLQFGFYMATGSLFVTPIVGVFAILAGKATTRPKEDNSDDGSFLTLRPLFSPRSSRWKRQPSTPPPTSSTSLAVTSPVRVSVDESMTSHERDRRITVSTITVSPGRFSAENPVTPSQILPMFKQTPQNRRNENARAHRLTSF
ncbi:uncharacterized protein LOC110462894 [Mizuhopecten yessoensis]|uniref:Uncharacterized protein n=1 Tax=Mizuhopecten yessoensis TaxID=6573 RepID=A0A210PXD9_MIZYE|nr:uncharacterized protein LOC110462894 [Mizuhopecten yessoensis]OWF41134.1 hypothetical protein KP79_PYT04769 [Mizuhopecten yessoensis]